MHCYSDLLGMCCHGSNCNFQHPNKVDVTFKAAQKCCTKFLPGLPWMIMNYNQVKTCQVQLPTSPPKQPPFAVGLGWHQSMKQGAGNQCTGVEWHHREALKGDNNQKAVTMDKWTKYLANWTASQKHCKVKKCVQRNQPTLLEDQTVLSEPFVGVQDWISRSDLLQVNV